jgi:hypothetical protein
MKKISMVGYLLTGILLFSVISTGCSSKTNFSSLSSSQKVFEKGTHVEISGDLKIENSKLLMLFDTTTCRFEIVQKANNIQLNKEKVKPIYEQLVHCKKCKNEIVLQLGDVNHNLYILLSGVIRLYYIDMDGNDITRYFGTKGCICTGSDEGSPYVLETLETCEFLMMNRDTLKIMIEEDIYWLKICNQLYKTASAIRSIGKAVSLRKVPLSAIWIL